MLVAAVAEITSTVGLPVTVDIETGYGATPDAVAATVARVIDAGGIGINLEDGLIGAEGLFSLDDQCARIAAARAAANKAGIPLFINARCDVFKKVPREQRTEAHVAAALQRADAYAKAGASGFFTP